MKATCQQLRQLMNMLLPQLTATWRILMLHRYNNLMWQEPIFWKSQTILNTTYHQPQILQLQVQRCKILLHTIICRKTVNSRIFLLSQALWYVPMCYLGSNVHWLTHWKEESSQPAFYNVFFSENEGELLIISLRRKKKHTKMYKRKHTHTRHCTPTHPCTHRAPY